MDVTPDAVLSRVPLDRDYAERYDLDNLCKALTPAELRDAALVSAELAAALHGFATSCEATASAVSAAHLTMNGDLEHLFRAYTEQNARFTTQLVDWSVVNGQAAMENLRAAGALLWLAEQREAGTS